MSLAEVLGEIDEALATRKLYGFKPYAWQKEFFDAGKTNSQRLLMAANGVGKCITYQTLVPVRGSFPKAIGELYERGEPFPVWAWKDGLRPALALAPIKKPGLHHCYRFTMKDGSWFEAADHHRVLSRNGWRRISEFQPACAEDPLPSSSDSVPSIHGEDDRRSSRRLPDYRGGYSADYRPGGVQPLSWKDSVRALLPSQGDVLQHTLPWWHSDAPQEEHIDSLFGMFCRLAMQGFPLSAGFRASALCQVFDSAVQPSPGLRRELPPLGTFASSDRASTRQAGTPSLPSSPVPILPSDLLTLNGNEVESVYYIGRQEIYDFTVCDYHNYVLGDVVHHNTYPGGYEVALHLTGEYPDWWNGHRFDGPILSWVGALTNDFQKISTQQSLLGSNLSTDLGTGWIPKHLISGKVRVRQAGIPDVADHVMVRHKSGGTSKVLFKTYEQGWRAWQSGAPNLIWMDEQHDENKVDEKMIFSEIQTRLFRSQGIFLATLTPLLGESKMIQHFTSEQSSGTYLQGATWDDAPHLTEEAKAQALAAYPAHERDVRSKGIPMMGEGAVFTTPEEDIKISPVQAPIQRHWARIKGIDFGSDHPAAVVDLAWDRDADIVYLTRTWKKAQCRDFKEHVQAINDKTPWIPVAWPHDGANTEKLSSGKRIKDAYAAEGVRMLSMSARYDRDKGGPQPVWPIVHTFRDRLETGGFKAYETCKDFFSEYRSYHTRDGKLSKHNDDVLKALFYALMMLKWASPDHTTTQSRRGRSAPIISMVRR